MGIDELKLGASRYSSTAPRLGAGFSIIESGRTEASSWSANNGCSAYRPECATSWTYHPSAKRCVHGTLWEAIQFKSKNL